MMGCQISLTPHLFYKSSPPSRLATFFLYHSCLQEISVVAKFAPTATDGKTYQVEHYTLEMSNTINSQAKLKQNPHLTRLIYIKH